jgi:hypothetical protein
MTLRRAFGVAATDLYHQAWRLMVLNVLLGAALLARMIELGWVRRMKGSRVVTVSPHGYPALQRWIGACCDGSAKSLTPPLGVAAPLAGKRA